MARKLSDTRHGVFLLDRDRLFGEVLASLLSNTGYDVVQIASRPEEIDLERLCEIDEHILITYVEDNESEIFDLLHQAKKIQPKIKIVVVTRPGRPPILEACLKIGVHAYLSTDISFESFLHFLSFASLDEKVLPIELAHSFLSAGETSSAPVMPFKDIEMNFTERERAILAYLIRGDSNKEMARHLGIADGTVKVSVKRILRRINATNRTQAAIWALQHASAESFLESANCSKEDKVSWSRANGQKHNGKTEEEPGETSHPVRIKFEDVTRPVL